MQPGGLDDRDDDDDDGGRGEGGKFSEGRMGAPIEERGDEAEI